MNNKQYKDFWIFKSHCRMVTHTSP